jgi:hypothetical protein
VKRLETTEAVLAIRFHPRAARDARDESVVREIVELVGHPNE